MENYDYFAVEYIFNLLCACRMSSNYDCRSLLHSIHKRGLSDFCKLKINTGYKVPKISFWIHLCQQTSLLNDGEMLYPTMFAESWFSWPLYDQMNYLFKEWIEMAKDRKTKYNRKNLLQFIATKKKLNTTQKNELTGLQALGLCSGEIISNLGMAILDNNSKILTHNSEKWRIEKERLLISFPPNWSSLWNLEKYVSPKVQGVYLLNARNFRLAVQRGALENEPKLLDIFRDELGSVIPESICKSLEAQAVIELKPGFVLEFSQPEELKRLRQVANLRSELDYVLSPRHVLINYFDGFQVINKLYRRGLLSENELITSKYVSLPNTTPGYLPNSDRSFMLLLLLVSKGLNIKLPTPPGFLARLTQEMDDQTKASAIKHSNKILKELIPSSIENDEIDNHTQTDNELIEIIQDIIDQEGSVDVVYQKPGVEGADIRHIRPLLIEKRGQRIYILAYCHDRKANRTFRLDRLKLV
jgi:hypothetical protein